MMSTTEPPIRTTTPLSEAGESSSELEGASIPYPSPAQQQQLQQQLQQQEQEHHAPRMSKAAHDAIFGRAASSSSHEIGAHHHHQHHHHEQQQRGPPIVAHEDDSFQQYLELRQQSLMNNAIYGSQPLFHQHDQQQPQQQQQQVIAMMATTGRSPRLMPAPVPPLSNVQDQAPSAVVDGQQHQQQTTAAPTALMIMRRRRSNSADFGNGSGHGSSRRTGRDNSDQLNSSGSNRSGGGTSAGSRSHENKDKASKGATSEGSVGSGSKQSGKPKGSPKNGSVSAPHRAADPNDPSNLDALLQQQRQQQQQQQASYLMGNMANNGIPMHRQHPQLTAMRYNSSLHSTLGGYPTGTPTQLTHPSVTLELIARDRARWEADYYSSYGMDYYQGNDYGYYGGGGGGPGLRGMQQGGAAAVQGGQMGMEMIHQGLYQPAAPNGRLSMPSQLQQPQLQQQQQKNFRDLQGNAVGRMPMPASPVPASQLLPEEGSVNLSARRVFQERDYKNDRIWQEDDHMSTTSKKDARPERRNTEKTSNTTVSGGETGPTLPSVPQLRTGGESLVHQGQQQPGQQQPRAVPQGVPPGRGTHMSIEEHDILSYNSAMSQYYQPATPSTPIRGSERDHRVRQISDLSSLGSVTGIPIPEGSAVAGGHLYPNPNGPVPFHHYHGLIYPPTPGSIGSIPSHPPVLYQHHHPQGRMWVDSHHQAGHQPAVAPQSTHVDPAEHSKSTSGLKTSLLAESKPQIKAPSPAPSSEAPSDLQASRSPKSKKRVSFSHLEIRTYETILGDNPSCSGGPPLGLGWRYDPTHVTATVDEYEVHLARLNGAGPDGCPLTTPPEELVLHRFEREAILFNTGYTRQDIADSIRVMNKVKNKRRQTMHNLPVAFIEERTEVVKKTLKRWLLKKQPTRSMYDDWKKRSNQGGGGRV